MDRYYAKIGPLNPMWRTDFVCGWQIYDRDQRDAAICWCVSGVVAKMVCEALSYAEDSRPRHEIVTEGAG